MLLISGDIMRSWVSQHQALRDADKCMLSGTLMAYHNQYCVLPAGYNNLDSGYAFGYDSIAFSPMSEMISYQRDLVMHRASLPTSLAGCCSAQTTQQWMRGMATICLSDLARQDAVRENWGFPCHLY